MPHTTDIHELFPTTDNPHNWQEDFSHENGNYFCRCVNCKKMFIGHKRRVICKLCNSLNHNTSQN